MKCSALNWPIWELLSSKRGYPHAHLVYTFKSEGPQHMDEMDKWVRARIPDESIANGLLRGNVLKYMIHKPFGPFNVTHTTAISPKCHHHTHIYGPTRNHSCIGLLRQRGTRSLRPNHLTSSSSVSYTHLTLPTKRIV